MILCRFTYWRIFVGLPFVAIDKNKESHSVNALKTKIMESQLIAFCEQDLKLDGKVREEFVALEDSGCVHAATVELSIRSWELHSDKNGVSINQVLQSLGIQESFANCASKRAEFVCKGGRVSVARTRPPSGLTLTSPSVSVPKPPTTSAKTWPIPKPIELPTSVKSSEENYDDAYPDLHTKL